MKNFNLLFLVYLFIFIPLSLHSQINSTSVTNNTIFVTNNWNTFGIATPIPSPGSQMDYFFQYTTALHKCASNQPPNVIISSATNVNVSTAIPLLSMLSDDGLPWNEVTNQWSKFSGPGNVTWSSTTITNPSVTFLAVGTYVVRCTASDGLATKYTDQRINVSSTVATPPTGTVTSPTPSATYKRGSTVQMAVTVSNPSGYSVKKIQFWLIDPSGQYTLLYEDLALPYAYSYVTKTTQAAGTYNLNINVIYTETTGGPDKSTTPAWVPFILQ